MLLESKIDWSRTSPNVEDLKRNLRITHNELDATLTDILAGAINWAELFIGRPIAVAEVTETRTLKLKASTQGRNITQRVAIPGIIELVDLYCLNSTQESLSAVCSFDVAKNQGDYLVVDLSQETSLSPFRKSVNGYVEMPVSITYTRGMLHVPPAIKQAIILRASYEFENPTETTRTVETKSEYLLRPFRYLSKLEDYTWEESET